MTNMTPMEGLQQINDYLDTRHYAQIEIDQNLGPVGNISIGAGYDFSFREILCSLLAGQGIRLPNIQICISLNLQALVGPLIGQIQAALAGALQALNNAFNSFLQHTGIQNVLNRINEVIAEVAAIANMINFCGEPIVPIPIPMSLENALQSFLGRGMDMINSIGSIIPSEIGGCLGTGGAGGGDPSFNGQIFNGGVLHDIWLDFDRVISGSLTDLEIEAYTTRIYDIIDEINNLIDEENNTTSVVNTGGSEFVDQVGELNLGVGALFNPDELGMQGTITVANGLRNSYNQLSGYPVVDSDGNVYNNIFELFLEDRMIDLLRRRPTPNRRITRQEPIYNYCGQIVGYNTVDVREGDPEQSRGSTPTVSDLPGAMKNNGITVETLTTPPTPTARTVFDDNITTQNMSNNEIFADAAITVPMNRTWFYALNVLGRRTDGNAAENIAKKIEGVAYNRNGVVTVPTDQMVETLYGSDIDGYAINITADGSLMKFDFNGIDGKQFEWTFKFSYMEA